jgi:hypothetical protein
LFVSCSNNINVLEIDEIKVVEAHYEIDYYHSYYTVYIYKGCVSYYDYTTFYDNYYPKAYLIKCKAYTKDEKLVKKQYIVYNLPKEYIYDNKLIVRELITNKGIHTYRNTFNHYSNYRSIAVRERTIKKHTKNGSIDYFYSRVYPKWLEKRKKDKIDIYL